MPAAAATPVATITEAGVGIPLPVLLARRGVIVGMELGGAAAVAEVGRGIAGRTDLPWPNALELALCVSSLGGIAAIRRLRAPALPELLAEHETVVRRTVVIAERTLTKS